MVIGFTQLNNLSVKAGAKTKIGDTKNESIGKIELRLIT